MTADVELLPCPFCGSAEPIVVEPSEILPTTFQIICSGIGCNAVVESRTLARAKLMWNRRANVAHATAAKDAEIEALRAEVERLRAIAGCAYQMAGVHDAPEVWLDRLGQAANGDALPDPDTISDELLPYQPDAVCEAEARAERLAEALRAERRWWVDRKADAIREQVGGLTRGDPGAIARCDAAIQRIDALLREQEEGRG